MKLRPIARRLIDVRVRGATLVLALLLPALRAQSPPPDPKNPKDDRFQFGTTVELVTIPVTIQGPNGQYVAGLEKEDFKVFDNDKEQKITGFDVSFLPISLVLCIESSGRVENLLPGIKKTGIVYSNLLLGEQGEAAVISFDSKVEVIQEFTKDPDKLITAIKKIKPGSDATRTSDAVFEAIRLLRSRPDNHRKVVVTVSENRDNGSEVHIGETMRTAQLLNISIYSIRLSTAKVKATQPAQVKRDPLPPAARPTAPGVVATPNTQAQSHVEVVNALPFIIEAVRGVKNAIFNDPLQALTESTGGKQLASLTEAGMEDSVARIGEELRSQYLISYRPSTLTEGGFHRIRVEVGQNGVKARYRPGYWLGPIPKGD